MAPAVGSTELSTAARLSEGSEVLQKTRLRYQLARLDRGESPSDLMSVRRLRPMDRSLIGQAVWEIATAVRGWPMRPNRWTRPAGVFTISG